MGSLSTAFADVASELCPRFLLASDQQACLDDLDGKSFANESITLCSQYSTRLKVQQKCYKNLADLSYAPATAKLCSSYLLLDKQEACYAELGNLSYSETAVENCTQRRTAEEQQACLANLGQPNVVAESLGEISF